MKYTLATAIVLILSFNTGCTSTSAKKPEYKLRPPEVVVSSEISTPHHDSDQYSPLLPENDPSDILLADDIPAGKSEYSEEETVVSTILSLYEDAKCAFDQGDNSLAKNRIDKAAVLTSDIDINSISDKSLVLRYTNTLSSLFLIYGNNLRIVDQINRDDPHVWLNQLSETHLEDFKNGKWKDNELRNIVSKISLRCDMPMEFNDSVKKSIYYFQTVGKTSMETWIRRSGRYLPVIREIFKKQGLPLDLAYLAMIESGLKPKAYSRKHCSGLWQFGSSTGRMYGLKATQWYDQRNDPVRATKASARYLSDLYQVYGDWLMVMAAYNWGPTNVNRRIKAGCTDFWSMRMPRETKTFVPSFMATVLIFKAPELFGFENIKKEAPLAFDTVEVSYMSLEIAAKCSQTSVKTLRELNSELTKSYTPAGQKYALKIPAGSRLHFLAEYAKLPEEKFTPPMVDIYYAKQGDTLSGIADKFNIPVKKLVSHNHIRNRHKLRVGQRLRISGGRDRKTYVIKKRDTLYAIALKHNVSYRNIMRWNNIRNPRAIRPGKKIIIRL